jgi:hypothetical protein
MLWEPALPAIELVSWQIIAGKAGSHRPAPTRSY